MLSKARIQITVCVTSAHSFVFSAITIASLLLFTVNKHGVLMNKAHASAVASWTLFCHFRAHVEMKKAMFV